MNEHKEKIQNLISKREQINKIVEEIKIQFLIGQPVEIFKDVKEGINNGISEFQKMINEWKEILFK